MSSSLARFGLLAAVIIGGAGVYDLAASQSKDLTLSTRDYKHVGGNVDCPRCKDLYCAEFQPPSGTLFTTVSFVRQRSKGHWYRCGVELNCGRPEFSNPRNPREKCDGLANCSVCRATDDATEAEDDITFTYK